MSPKIRLGGVKIRDKSFAGGYNTFALFFNYQIKKSPGGGLTKLAKD